MEVVTLGLLGLSAGATVLSLVLAQRQRYTPAVLWLLAAALGLRLALIGADPFLHDWDERFHALVAKNMLATGWARPVLRAHPVLPYDYRQWPSNHVWLHKQPLFMWQMALSMKLFGSSAMAVRVPSALLGSLLLWPVYRLGRLIFGPAVGYHAALLLAFAYYQLELTTGWQSVDHSDVAFACYITGSVWAYYESRQPHAGAWWSGLVGLLAGAAVLCKWLPGLVVYTSWALEIVLRPDYRARPREYGRLLAALGVTLLVVLPWQLYIHQQFPVESAFEQTYAARHFGQVLEGHGEAWYFYLTQDMWYQYQWLVLLVGGGLGLLLTAPYRQRPVRPLLVSCGVLFAFFSAAATKMPSYTYAVAPLLLVVAAVAWVAGLEWLRPRLGRWGQVGAAVGLGVLLVLALRPWALLKHHTDWLAAEPLVRQRNVQHTAVYQQLDGLVPAGYVVFGVPVLEEVEAMFYSRQNVYAGLPSLAEYQALRAQGLRIAIFAPTGWQTLPPYLATKEVLLLPANLK